MNVKAPESPTEAQVDAATRLVKASPRRPEDNIRQDLGRLLDALEVESILTFRTDAGPADLYLPRRRTIIETKSGGLADEPNKPQARENNETPLQQLERYLRAEIATELGYLDLEGQGDRPWVGILTDGHVWHAWRYAHEVSSARQAVFTNFRPANAAELIARIGPLFGGNPIGKPWIPERPQEIFRDWLPTLENLMGTLSGRAQRETDTKRSLWLDMLRTSSMAPNNQYQQQRLFVAHSFLVTIARGVVHTVARPNDDPDPKRILEDGFVAWILESHAGRHWAQGLLDRIHGYEWRRRHGDVLRSVYEAFIEADDRKIFGEYYTPDWLAELLVEEILDEDWCNAAAGDALRAERGDLSLTGRGILDPSCGSGTFLYHAAKRLLRCTTLQEDSLPLARKSDAVTRLVWGIDIHPVAIEIARATLMRALPLPPPDGPPALRVYQGDSLRAQRDAADTLFTPSDDILEFESPAGRRIRLPRSFAEDRHFSTHLRRLVEAAKAKRDLPPDLLDTVPERDRDALQTCRREFEAIIDKEGNSVWAWYVVNVTAPLLLSQRKVDRIIANPPWVTMAEIQVKQRKVVLKKLAEDLDLWDGGKQAPHHDIAQLFVKRCRQQYLANPGTDPAAWLVKKAALIGGHWGKFREWHQEVRRQVLDLQKAQPFGGGDARRCVAFLEYRACSRIVTATGRILTVEPVKQLRPEMQMQEAMLWLKFAPAPKPKPQAISAYCNAGFRQGASLVPSVLVLVDHYEVSTDGRQAAVTTIRSSKSHWKQIAPRSGQVPVDWLRPVRKSTDLLPFALLASSAAIVPVTADGFLDDEPELLSRFWADNEDLYREYRTEGKHNPKSLFERVDYGNSLSAQLPSKPMSRKLLVVYPKSGDIMRAARAVPSTAVFNDTLYYWRANSQDEAAYLVGLLNAPALNTAFVQARTSQRHFDLGPWRTVPIPKFVRRDSDHRKLARLVGRAEAHVTSWLAKNGKASNLKQVGLSKRIRQHLTQVGLVSEINSVVQRILPKHVD